MNNIENTKKLVLSALEDNARTRDSDDYLYYVICRRILNEKGIDIRRITLENFLLCRKEYKLPAFETVRRTRQKVQEKNPHLRSSKDVAACRKVKQKAFEAWAKEGLL